METTEKVKNAANTAKQKISEKASSEQVRSFVDQVSDVGHQVQQQVGQYADRATAATVDSLKKYPVRSTLIALGVGFTIGSLFALMRRK